MKNYKYGILPKYRKVKTNLDEMQNTFVSVVEDLENDYNYDYNYDYSDNNDNTIVMNKFDFRHIKDISNVVKYDTLAEPLNEVFKNYLDNSDLSCEIEEGAMFAGAPDHAMPINFLLCKGNKKVAILLMGFRRIHI